VEEHQAGTSLPGWLRGILGRDCVCIMPLLSWSTPTGTDGAKMGATEGFAEPHRPPEIARVREEFRAFIPEHVMS